MKLFPLVFLLILTPINCFADWTKKDTVLETSYLMLHSADWLQTRHISKNDSYKERNLILGKYPSTAKVDRYFFLTGLAHVALVYFWDEIPFLSPKLKNYFQYFTIGIQAGCVYHNFRCGVKFEF